MSEYNEGDLVEVVKGEAVMRSRVAPGLNGSPALEGMVWPLESLLREGWTLTVIEKATPPLPTEPGIYSTDNGEAWTLDGDGEFKSTRRSVYLATDGAADREVLEEVGPFTRLEPAAETAKRLVDALSAEVDEQIAQRPSWLTKGTAGEIVRIARRIAKEFGAQS